MAAPLAYFLTWTTYGTWLPGDERGWVDQRTSGPDQPILPPDPERRAAAQRNLKHPPVQLTHEQRTQVEQVVRTVCAYRGWNLHAVNCRTNHVHLVVTAHDVAPERVMNQLKAWVSRRLNEMEAKTVERHWWTRHGSTRYLNDEEALAEAVDYVLNRQESLPRRSD